MKKKQTFDKRSFQLSMYAMSPFATDSLRCNVTSSESRDILLYCKDTQLIKGGGNGVVLTNVVYPTLLLRSEDFQ